MRRRNPNHPCLQPKLGGGHWERQDAKMCEVCRPVEHKVSALLRERFRFRVVGIVDREFRNLMERKLIASLAACPRCGPSKNWLGRYAYSDKVISSGLWNSQYVGEDVFFSQDEWDRFTRATDDTKESLVEEEDTLSILGFGLFGGYKDIDFGGPD